MIANQHVLDHWPLRRMPVEFNDDIDRVQRLAAGAAARQGFATTGAELVERVAADMATHLVERGGAGQMLVRSAEWAERRGVELLSTDSADAYSEADIREIALAADLFEAYTAPGKGTAMMARFWDGPQTRAADRRYLVGSTVEPIDGEVVSGDAWGVEQHGDRVVALVADGLGHGEQAAVASAAAVSAFRVHHHEPVESIAAHVHRALRLSRGAAIALAEIDLETYRLRFCGIGNITARVLTAESVYELVSLYGIAGYQNPRIQVFTRAWPKGAMLVMHTDGLSSKWDGATYPQLHLQHPQLVASTVMRDAVRARDDALVLAVRSTGEAAPPHDPETS